MIEKKVWFIAGGRGGPGVDIARGEPSHIHVPRPSRVMRPDQERHVACLQEQIDAGSDLSTAVASDDMQPTGNRR